MTRLFAALLIIKLSRAYWPGGRGGSTPIHVDAKAALKQAKVHTWRRLYNDNDVKGLDAFLSDDFVIIGANGTPQTKAQILAEMKAHPWAMLDDFLHLHRHYLPNA